MEVFIVEETQPLMTAVVDDPEINEIFAKWVQTTDPVEANKILKGLNQLWLAKANYAYAPSPMVTPGSLAMGGELLRRSQ